MKTKVWSVIVTSIVLVAGYCGYAHGVEDEVSETRDPIEVQEGLCLQKAMSTLEMVNCSNSALNSWEKELASSYTDLTTILPVKSGQSFVVAQAQWKIYRDAEYDLVNQYYGSLQGSRYQLENIARKVGIAKERVRSLREYRKSFQDYVERNK